MKNIKYWFQPKSTSAAMPRASYYGDRRNDEAVYVYNGDALVQAVNVAGASARPLLISGPSGCGKTSLAFHIAASMDWPLHMMSITSRMQARDFLYTIDHLKRMQDAQAGKLAEWGKYIRPGPLWLAFDPAGAKEGKGGVPLKINKQKAMKLPEPGPVNGAVVLLDEIDKADPDVPNNLLEPLGSYEFAVDEMEDTKVYARRFPFIVLTTNNERRLPTAFLRRCIQIEVSWPNEAFLRSVGQAHYPTVPVEQISRIAKLLSEGKDKTSIAEFLDTVHACYSLNIDPSSDDWNWLKNLTAVKGAGRRDPL